MEKPISHRFRSKSETLYRELPKISLKSIFPKYSTGGLKHTFHGDIYQLKLLLNLCLTSEDYDLCVATEVKEAGKFDDIVWFARRKSCIILTFVQVKHVQEPDTQKITISDLMNETNGDYSLLKYFHSFRQIKGHFKIMNSVRRLFIWTDIGFSDRLLKDSPESHKFELQKSNGKHYQILLLPESPLFEKFKYSTNFHMLAKTLAEHFADQIKMTLNDPMLLLYHKVLINKKILEIVKDEKRKARFTQDFIRKKCPEETHMFREAFINKYKQLMAMKKMQSKIENLPSIEVSKKFGDIFEQCDLLLQDPTGFATLVVKAAMGSTNNIISNLNGKEKFPNAFDKISVHVFVYAYKNPRAHGFDHIKFKPAFLLTILRPDINIYLNAIKELSGNSTDFLNQCRFKINKYDTCYENEFPKISKETASILNNPSSFGKKLADLIRKSQPKTEISLDRRIFNNEMDKLAGYVFVYADSNDATYIKFRSSTFLRPDIEEFKATVSATVKKNPVVEKMLMETVFKVREYYCCHENGAFPEKFSAEQLKHKSAINLALQKPKKLANELLALVSSEKNINTVIINRNIDGKEVNVNSLKKLSGHVFVYANSKTTDEIVFNDSFFVDDYIRWDIDIFKDELKKQLKDEFTNLKNYVFKVKDYNSFYPEELVSELPIDEKIEDKEIKKFFDELYFAVNQEDEVKLEQSMRERMTLKYGKAQGNIIYDYMMISVLNWLKEKGENPLDSDDIKERIENAKQQIRQLKTESSK